jgi:hypothetical protein
MNQTRLPKLAQKIQAIHGVASIEKEIDQWVCYSISDYWFPLLECQTCIDTNLKTVWDLVRSVEPKPPGYE